MSAERDSFRAERSAPVMFEPEIAKVRKQLHEIEAVLWKKRTRSKFRPSIFQGTQKANF
jgi:hypothetical protein